jgi:hypothetical protein
MQTHSAHIQLRDEKTKAMDKNTKAIQNILSHSILLL